MLYVVLLSDTESGADPAVAESIVRDGAPSTVISFIACTSYVTVCVAVFAACATAETPKVTNAIAINPKNTLFTFMKNNSSSFFTHLCTSASDDKNTLSRPAKADLKNPFDFKML
jgi:hypothetical protein